ncbi:acyl-CoA dehydrogenase family protein [Brevibacterium casei]|uniref:acyl-CoA oxidase n=6 Tax=Brevibacterium casei TaxID=33889 RepID=K9AUM4_9MICO|nr:acyl-CoA dehydrogenase [Brevibacterium casei]EKU49766.1 acyl-CoA oxidase domain-containing protein [Brevibacterium casei S18]MBE4693854.1 acyl-CoA dehydrogenase [Brevibacterium casei]MBY3576977.1 acyl-CoA dehydrogenase [Brevibacterium casei]MCT1550595.1 acyl-CoA dehydrogenase family protein [Brevibacterium casei]MCT1559787.1 acyl-CoA dehydrogenase family protein [Brevibacterium casei]
MNDFALDLDPTAIQTILDGDWADARHLGRQLALDETTHLDPADDLETTRATTLTAVGLMAATELPMAALPAALGGTNEHARTVAGFEETVTASPSLQIKAGVQFGLFGGAILHLGNPDQHAQWLVPAQKGQLLGSFAMTEIGHGSDVAAIGTTATFDPETDEFVIDTPFTAATKEYIGNAARDARAAVVFAQLITAGVNHGVHALFVPVRTEAGEPMPGVSISDDGFKGGLRGVDNGRFAFDAVRVPRTNLLDRYGAVDETGAYTSPIDSPGRRFFTMLGTLVQGRVSLDGAAVVASKLALDIAVRYGLERKQFTTVDDYTETTLLDYQQHQRRLMPALAATYASALAHEKLLTSFEEVFSGADDSEENRALLETRAAAFKADSTWMALDVIQECREACGGAGFMAENRLVGLRADMDVYVTFEGDNTVLLQLVAKRILGDYAKEFAHIDVGGAARYIGTQAAEHTLYRTGLANAGLAISDVFTPNLSERRIRSGRLQRTLLESRLEVMVSGLAAALRPAARLSPEKAAELFNSQQHELVEMARAYVELEKWKAIDEAMKEQKDPAQEKIFRRLRDTYGLSLIEKHMGWHLMYGRLPMSRARQVGETLNRLCAKLAANALDLVDAFGYGDDHRRATIATGIEAERQAEAAAYYRRARAQRDYPVPEKQLRKTGSRTA